ncbi:Aste57867_13327 [Aphanomyces stellatus]|uniref:Aste57867_13327 protein n=1 Tax=Aphanomyces stellatus TaxID=120398 RepID=A0A485KZJ2_9STRA|nr:hypothetical protein As57867_013278 [Aphanomyces stellatus]VFT90166.1 Aste57867_13327 [Aphanomyces stellatus]
MSAPKALCKAVSDGNMTELRKLLPDCNVNEPSDPESKYCGKAPLHIVCESGRLNVLMLLLSIPAINVNIQTPYLETPLYFACQHGHIDVVHQLLGRPETNVNIASGNDWTPLHSACENGFAEIAQLLLARSGVDVNLIAWRRTPLHLACSQGHANVVRLLLAHPNLRIPSTGPHTPLHLAAKHCHTDVIEMLLEYAATSDDSAAAALWLVFLDDAFPLDKAARSAVLKSISTRVDSSVLANRVGSAVLGFFQS